MHAEDPELAHERIDHHLEHVGEHVLLGIGLRMEFDRRVAFAFGEERRVALGGIGRKLGKHIEQLRHAGAGSRRHEADGHEVALAQRLLERYMELVGRYFSLLEV